MSNVIPTLLYQDPERMIDWLAAAFGFEEHFIAHGDGGAVIHAELRLPAPEGGGARGMIMLGAAREDGFGAHQTTPAALGGTTQSAYLVVPDPDALYASAKRSGAEIAQDIADQAHGGRAFACRDPEGHLWSVGSYDPWRGGA